MQNREAMSTLSKVLADTEERFRRLNDTDATHEQKPDEFRRMLRLFRQAEEAIADLEAAFAEGDMWEC